MLKIVALISASVIVFFIDLFSPLEVSIFAIYMLIIGISTWVLPKKYTAPFLIFNIVLIFVGFFPYPSGLTYIIGLFNRFLVTGLVIALYFVMTKYKFTLIKLNTSILDLERNIKENEFLSREIHHRTKNNLQIIQSILKLESDEFNNPEVKSFARISMERIHSISLLHDKLYRPDSASVDRLNAREYLNDIIFYLLKSYQKANVKINYKLDVDDKIELKIDKIIYLGLILNELLTNSMKYAFANRLEGDIEVKLKSDSSRLLFFYCDNGIGMNESSIQSTQKLGMLLIQSFAVQVNGEYKFYNKNGLIFEMYFDQ